MVGPWHHFYLQMPAVRFSPSSDKHAHARVFRERDSVNASRLSNRLIWGLIVPGQQHQPINPEHLPRDVFDRLNSLQIRFPDSGLNADLALAIVFPRTHRQPVPLNGHIVAVVTWAAGLGVMIEPLERDGIVLAVCCYDLVVRHADQGLSPRAELKGGRL